MSASPLRSVLTAFETGARSRTDVCDRTGLRRDVVEDVPPPAREHHAPPGPGERQGGGLADAGARPRHDRDPARL